MSLHLSSLDSFRYHISPSYISWKGKLPLFSFLLSQRLRALQGPCYQDVDSGAGHSAQKAQGRFCKNLVQIQLLGEEFWFTLGGIQQ